MNKEIKYWEIMLKPNSKNQQRTMCGAGIFYDYKQALEKFNSYTFDFYSEIELIEHTVSHTTIAVREDK